MHTKGLWFRRFAHVSITLIITYGFEICDMQKHKRALAHTHTHTQSVISLLLITRSNCEWSLVFPTREFPLLAAASLSMCVSVSKKWLHAAPPGAFEVHTHTLTQTALKPEPDNVCSPTGYSSPLRYMLFPFALADTYTHTFLKKWWHTMAGEGEKREDRALLFHYFLSSEWVVFPCRPSLLQYLLWAMPVHSNLPLLV